MVTGREEKIKRKKGKTKTPKVQLILSYYSNKGNQKNTKG